MALDASRISLKCVKQHFQRCSLSAARCCSSHAIVLPLPQGLVRNSSITRLNLSDNSIGEAMPSAAPAAAAASAAPLYKGPGVLLAEVLRRNRCLRELDLTDNPQLGVQVRSRGTGGVI